MAINFHITPDPRHAAVNAHQNCRAKSTLESSAVHGFFSQAPHAVIRVLISPMDTCIYASLISDSASIPSAPVKYGTFAGLCRQKDIASDNYRYWCGQLQLSPALHRKWWEYYFVAQNLFELDLLRSDSRGLVFGVGTEPLPALFAKHGCQVLATDQAAETAEAAGWIKGGMHAAALKQLMIRSICPVEQFSERVTFKEMDMNNIDRDLDEQFDFCWSTCSFEHLGSLEHGLQFVENSIRTLKPGGYAIHTTEFNLSSDQDTLEHKDLCLYRKRDLLSLFNRLRKAGHKVHPINFDRGSTFIDGYIDLPPYHSEPHLRIRVGEYDCTSIGMIIQRGN